MSDYSEKVCEACQPDADPATKEEINEFLSGNSDWQLIESDAIKKIERTYKFKNFITFCTGIVFIIISEISLRYSGLSLNNMVIYFLIPLTIFFTIYAYIFFNNKNYRRK